MRELRTLLQTNVAGREYSSIKTILNKVFGQNTYFEDPLNKLYDGLKSSLTFSFPDSCINDINVNFRTNELNLLSGHSPLFLHTHTLTPRSLSFSACVCISLALSLPVYLCFSRSLTFALLHSRPLALSPSRSLSLSLSLTRVQLLDGGRILDDSFPPLRNFIRLNLHTSLESDCLRNVYRGLYDQSRYEFLKRIFYPEMHNQMGGIIKRWKLSAQVRIAEKEMKSRLLQNSRYFFEELSDQELKKWLQKAKKELHDQNTYLKRSHLEVKHFNPSLGIQMPLSQHFKYSFMNLSATHDNLNQAIANTVSAVANGSRFSWLSPQRLPIRNHPLNLSIFAQLAQGLPLKTYLNTDDKIHSDDNVRQDRVDNREMENLMLFLSYGTWKPNHSRDNCVIKDSSIQTLMSCCNYFLLIFIFPASHCIFFFLTSFNE